ncbi:MAG: RNA-binding domain-containing protein [Candidatus Helarchaeota archaeon]
MKEIKDIEIEAFIQATEDPEKVVLAIQKMLPPNIECERFMTSNVRGVYHNPIQIIRTKLTQNTRQILEYIAKRISDADKNYLLQTLSRRIQNNNLYLRFDKQALYRNIVQLREIKDTIRVRIGFSRKYSNQEKMKGFLQELELIPL